MSIEVAGGYADVFCGEPIQGQEKDWIAHEIETTRKISLPEIQQASEMFSQRAAVFSVDRVSPGSLNREKDQNLYTTLFRNKMDSELLTGINETLG